MKHNKYEIGDKVICTAIEYDGGRRMISYDSYYPTINPKLVVLEIIGHNGGYYKLFIPNDHPLKLSSNPIDSFVLKDFGVDSKYLGKGGWNVAVSFILGLAKKS